jgi:UDP-GlcNAc:undecaprenyl-phosphate GlcNAc-1-phosphate transferase
VNNILLTNISNLLTLTLIAFVITFFITPIVGRIAGKIGAIDLPAAQRKRTERGLTTRLHAYPYPKLGGLAMVITMSIMVGAFLLTSDSYSSISNYLGVFVGLAIVIALGFVDDIWEISATTQLGLQFLAAFCVVISGVSINSLSLFGINIDFQAFNIVFQMGEYTFSLVFPAAIITILWIVGLINVINWVGGVDALNGTVTSIALVTLLILVASTGNLPLAGLIAIHLGSVLGVLPFNYNPGKIMYGSIGDYVNGYLLAIFAILGGARWSATLLILALTIVDGMFVVYTRFRDFPELRSRPWMLFSVSGYNHFHHRLLASGYTKKLVVLVEGAIMAVVAGIILTLSDLRFEYLVFILILIILFAVFAYTSFQKKRAELRNRVKLATDLVDEEQKGGNKKEDVVVKTVYQSSADKDEKFIY